VEPYPFLFVRILFILFCCPYNVDNVTAPFELIKNATQTSVLMATETPRGPTISSIQSEGAGRVSGWNACKQIVQRRGILGLYTGFQLHLLRDVIGSGIYFGVYESTKQTMTAYTGAEKPNTMTAIAISGWICGIFSWVVVSCLPPPLPVWVFRLGLTYILSDLPPRHDEDACAKLPRRPRRPGAERQRLRRPRDRGSPRLDMEGRRDDDRAVLIAEHDPDVDLRVRQNADQRARVP
jgi:Mitochondrial carrier protein